MRSVGYQLLHHLAYFCQLVHQTHLVMEATSGVDYHHVGLAGHGRLQRIVSYGGRVGSHALLHDGHSHAVGPEHELLHSSSAKGIRCSQYHAAPSLLIAIG